MSRWFRFYDDVINDPKVLKLAPDMRWYWTALLCVASKYDGRIPSLADTALLLRLPNHKVTPILAGLVNAGLLDKTETGFEPHNWNGRQYKSDVSTERVKRFRKRERNVSETPPDTEDRSREQKDSEANASGAVAPRNEQFEEFWKAYPRRHGANPKAPAEKLFAAAVKAGADATAIIDGAKRCANVDAAKIGTEFIPQAVKWLRDKRWQDYLAVRDAPDGTLDYDAAVKMFARTGVWSRYAPCGEPGQASCTVPPEIFAKYGLLPDGRKIQNETTH